MAVFDNVTYTYYSSTMGRSTVPNETTFNSYKLENVQFVKRLYERELIIELEDYGIDQAVCLMIEKDYLEAQRLSGNGSKVVASESVSGHSVSFDNTANSKTSELNAKSLETQKIECLKLFCLLSTGVR